MPEVWFLRRGDLLLGTLTEPSPDQPWVIYRFEPTAAFEEVRPVFERFTAIVDAETFDAEAWKSARLSIKEKGIVLEAAAGGPTIQDFALNLRGSKAWVRY